MRTPIGWDKAGAPVEVDIKEEAEQGMGSHGLILGYTGSGKSTLLNLVSALDVPTAGTIRIDGADFYVRQFHDMKGSVDLGELNAETFAEYAAGCAAILARAHAQSANAAVLRGYFGSGGKAAEAVVTWCYRYADKTVDDFDQLTAAARDGAIEVADSPEMK